MVLGSAPPTMAIAVGVSPTRTIAPVYKVRAADFITHDAADDGTDRSRDDGSDARTDADAFDFASLGGKRVKSVRKSSRALTRSAAKILD